MERMNSELSSDSFEATPVGRGRVSVMAVEASMTEPSLMEMSVERT